MKTCIINTLFVIESLTIVNLLNKVQFPFVKVFPPQMLSSSSEGAIVQAVPIAFAPVYFSILISPVLILQHFWYGCIQCSIIRSIEKHFSNKPTLDRKQKLNISLFTFYSKDYYFYTGCLHGLFLGLKNIMSWTSKQTLWHFSVVINKSLYGEN